MIPGGTKMSDFSNGNKVVQSNKLIVGRWGLSATQLKLFEMAVSCIDTSVPKPSREITMNKQDIFNLFEYSNNDRYVVFQRHIKELQKQSVTIDGANGKKRSLVLVPTVEWSTDNDDSKVVFKFNEDIMPYLIELQDHFTQYEILELQGMSSQYSIILFKYLVMEHNKRIGKDPHKESGYVRFVMSVDELRNVTATEKKYSVWKDLRVRVIEPAMNEINAVRENDTGKTNFLAKYELKKGRYNRVTDVVFYVRKRLSVTDNDFDNPPKVNWSNSTRAEIGNNITADDFHQKYYKAKRDYNEEERIDINGDKFNQLVIDVEE